ncbi:MAG: heavy metal translocating P-type ATPase [Arenicellales bacterium]|nr:heavy metal translocating P-type ATPase [Arenicellales bacterium]
MSTDNCFHCGLPLPTEDNYTVNILGKQRAVCCPGCQAVAQVIVNGGFERFYDKRTAKSQTPETSTDHELEIYSDPEVQSRFIRDIDEHTNEVTLNVKGINCGACLWLIESCLAEVRGVESVMVNYTTRRALVTWDKDTTTLQRILQKFRDIGFTAYPYEYREGATLLHGERDQQLRRMGISGVLGMQIMMIAVALYFGKTSGIAQNYELFFEWISMLLALPIVFYCAQPFFRGAWRSIIHKQPSVDLPVSLGIGIAFAASVWATITATGDTYFEAVAMFVFLLLAVRYFELVARERGLDAVSHIQNSIPTLSTRIDEQGNLLQTPATRLKVNDHVLVGVGARIPTDAVLVEGATAVDESVISGESDPVSKQVNDELVGGSINLDSPITIRVTRTHDHSTVSTIAYLAERAQSAKPRFVQLVDRIAVWFVIGVILVAAVVAAYCWWYAPERLLTTVIVVLVIACPCALSLATPAAISASVGALTRRGIVLLRGDCLEKLTQISHVVFDKTGTLTKGELAIDEIDLYGSYSEMEVLSIAGALEASSTAHPISQALVKALKDKNNGLRAAQKVVHTAGGGVTGTVLDKSYHFGSQQFIEEKLGKEVAEACSTSQQRKKGTTVSLLANETGVMARFHFSDELRPEAKEVVTQLKAEGKKTSILSGDRHQAVTKVAAAVGISEYHAQLSPQQKLDQLRHYHADGESVLAVGDGVNDAPILGAALVGVAMGSAVDLTQAAGDVVSLNDRLTDLNYLLKQAEKTRRIIMQNFIWALGYNVLALPLGIVGLVPPWVAVIGMSLSSLIVVTNALRLSKRQTSPARDLGDINESLAYA